MSGAPINEAFFKSDDYFMLLDLPLACDDLARIEQALKLKQSEWSKKSNSDPRYAENYRQLSKRLPDIARIMKDSYERAQLRIKLEQTRRAAIDERLRAANAVARTLNAAGQISQEQLEAFVKAYAHPDGPPETQVRALVTAQTKSAGKPVTSARPVLNRTIFEEIGRTLAILSTADLYTFLGVPRDATDAAIRRKQQELQSIWSVKPTGPERSAADQSLSKITTYLMTPNQRIAYDNALDDARLPPLRDALRILLTSGSLNVEQTQELLRLAAEHGIGRERALEVIREEATKTGAHLEVPAIENGSDNERVCANCGSVLAGGMKTCSLCGAPLEVACPVCRISVATSDKRCPSCTMPTSDMLLFARDLRGIEERLVRHNLTGSETALEQASAYFARYGVCAALQAVAVKVEESRSRCNKTVQEAEMAMAQRQLYAARRLWMQAANQDIGNNEVQKHVQDVAHLLSEIEAQLQQAQALEAQGCSEQSVGLFFHLLKRCSDCAAAEKGLRRRPPMPPGSGSANVVGLRVTLCWKQSPSSHVEQYRVVRKAGGIPTDADDSESLGNVSSLAFDDIRAPVGKVLFYAIYALRGGAPSTTGVAIGPVQVLADVRDLVAEAGDGVVTLTWKIPGEVVGIKVVRRKDRFARHLQDGEDVPVNGQTQARDANLPNGQTIYYAVFCLYFSSTRQQVSSAGASVTARPEPPPAPIPALQVHLENDAILIDWIAPSRDEVIIVRHDKPLTIAQGALIPRSRLHTLGTPLRTARTGQAVDTIGEGVRFYTALTLGGQTAIVGITQRFACVPDATATRLDLSGGLLEAYWKWPPGTTLARVGWRSDAYPVGPTDPLAVFMDITRAEFDRMGRLRFAIDKVTHRSAPTFVGNIEMPDLPFSVETWTDCYLAVFVGTRTKEGEVFASGQSPGARARRSCAPPVRVTYSLSKKLFSSARTLTVSAGKACAISGMVLIAKQGTLPLDAKDGVSVAEFHHVSLEYKQYAVRLPPIPHGHFVKLFLTDADDINRFVLEHPLREQLHIV